MAQEVLKQGRTTVFHPMETESDCSICCDQIKGKYLVCPNCQNFFCVVCQKRYAKNDCMNCHMRFKNSTIVEAMGKTFIDKVIKPKMIEELMVEQKEQLRCAVEFDASVPRNACQPWWPCLRRSRRPGAPINLPRTALAIALADQIRPLCSARNRGASTYSKRENADWPMAPLKTPGSTFGRMPNRALQTSSFRRWKRSLE